MGYFKWIAALVLVTLASTISASTSYYFRLSLTDVNSNNVATYAADAVMLTMSSALNDTGESEYRGTHSMLVSSTSTSIPNSISIISVSLSEDYRIDLVGKLVYKHLINAPRTILIGGSNVTIVYLKVYSNLQDAQQGTNAEMLEVCKRDSFICPSELNCMDAEFEPMCIERCDYGQYLNVTRCVNCPPNKTTLTKGAVSSDKCIDICPRGSYFSLVNSACIACAKDLYWNEADGSCHVCPFENFNSTTCTNGTVRQVNNRRINIDMDATLVTSSSCTLYNFSARIKEKDAASYYVKSFVSYVSYYKRYYKGMCLPAFVPCDNIEATIVNNEVCVPDPAYCSNQICTLFKTKMHITVFYTWDYLEPVIDMYMSQFNRSSVDALLELLFDVPDQMRSALNVLKFNLRFEMPFNPKITVVDIQSKQLFGRLMIKTNSLNEYTPIEITLRQTISDKLRSTVPEFLMLEIKSYSNCSVPNIPAFCVNVTLWLKQNASEVLLQKLADILIQSHEKVIGKTGNFTLLGSISLYRSQQDLEAGVNAINFCERLNKLNLAASFCVSGNTCVGVNGSGQFICQNLTSTTVSSSSSLYSSSTAAAKTTLSSKPSSTTYSTTTSTQTTTMKPTTTRKTTTSGSTVSSKKQRALYPYGISANDTQVPTSGGSNFYYWYDAISKPIYFSTGVPFGSDLLKEACVLPNGLITFGKRNRVWNSDLRILHKEGDVYVLAPFWSYTNPTFTGRVFYQLYEKSSSSTGAAGVLTRSSTEVKEQFGLDSYNAISALVVTWKNVEPDSWYNKICDNYDDWKQYDWWKLKYQSLYDQYCLNQKSESNTFQAVYVTDGLTGYAIVTYQAGETRWNFEQNRYISVGFAHPDAYRDYGVTYTDLTTKMDSIVWNSGRYGTWIEKVGEAKNPDSECYDFYLRNKYLMSDARHKKQVKALFDCPCTLGSRGAQWASYSWTDVEDKKGKFSIICYAISPMAKTRLARFQGNPLNKLCCYKYVWYKGLSNSPYISYRDPNAGHLLMNDPWQWLGNVRKSKEEDFNPHKWCCEDSSSPSYFCSLYNQVRPDYGCSLNAEFISGRALGDPHIKTLDGFEYAFNGLGEYCMICMDDFTLQARTAQAINSQGNKTNATIFVAFAAKEGNDSRFQVELDALKTGMIITANNHDCTTAFYDLKNYNETFDNNSISVKRMENENKTVLVVSFPSGESVEVYVGVNNLEFSVNMPMEFKGKLKGLMGNFNDNPEDDFELQNGTHLSPNSTERDIFEKFGKDWEVTTTTSIFTYPPGETALNYQHPEFRPLFKKDIDPDLLAKAKLKCGDNDACIFDLVLTGNEEFATNTKNGMMQASIVQAAQKNQLPELKIDNSVLNSKHQWEVTQGKAAQIKFTASDADPEDTVTYMLRESASSNLSIDSTGLLSYTPNINSPVTIGVQAQDSKGGQSNIVYVDLVVCPDCSAQGVCDRSRTQENEMENGRFLLSVCSCWPAYTGANCELNYDACKDQPCLTGQKCTDKTPAEQGNSTTGYSCGFCPVGYEERDSFCVDINECIANGTEPVCPQHAECENTVGSYSCACLPGYRLDPKNDSVCKDVDECAEKTHDCQQVCDNTEGGFNCSCLPGNTLNSDKKTCKQDLTSATLCTNKGCNQICTVTGGVANCACYTGYTNSTETFCKDIDECTLSNKPCSQSCQNTVGGFLCSCYPGYKLDIDNVSCKKCETSYYGVNCSGVCICNGHGTCDNIRGCECNAGWSGINCNQDVNECNTNGACPIGQICVNTLGSFYCQCADGYKNISGVCQDINECLNVLDNTCDLSLEDCVNNQGSYTCQCRSGFTRDKNNVCKDIDECATSTHNCEQICENTVGKFNCKCNYGFTLNLDRASCVKSKDVCAGKNFNCSDICTVDLTTQQPYCLCKSGFSLQGTGKCVDINECDFTSLNLCGQKDKCTNTVGGYNCSCSPGYKLDNDGRTCLACSQGKWGEECANDCACSTGADRCDPRKGCICKSGFTGTKCENDLDECTTGMLVCPASEECNNTYGSASCQCIKGYNKVNGKCQDIDECASYLTNDCDQVCQNNNGGYTCSCHSGYKYNSLDKTCSDINECTLKLAKCEQLCENTNGGYHCSCLSGLNLSVDGVTCAVSSQCTTKSCSEKCAVVNGTETCLCPKGKTLSGTNDLLCIDVDMCFGSPCVDGCKESLDGTSFICTCPKGKKLASDGITCTECTEGTYGDGCSLSCSCSVANTVSCDKITGTCNCKSGWSGSICGTDIDECTSSPSCTANSKCVNTPGSYICKCDAGFYTSGTNCSACTSGTYGVECSNQCTCDLTHSTCSATDGSCLCNSGWTGIRCDTDINECDSASNTCVLDNKPHWICKNTAGSYTCGCDKGYKDKSGTCVDLDECATSYTNECDGSCTNTEGSYTCSCNTGYKLASDGHACDDIDECTQGTSGCQQKCVNEVGNFSCACDTGYTVDDTDWKKCYASSGFGYQVKIEIDVSTKNLREKQGTDYLVLKAKLEDCIYQAIIEKIAGLKKIAINNMKHGSVIVDFTSVVDKTVTGYAASKMVEAILSIAESGILVDNQKENATVIIGNITVPPVKDKCIILNALEPCDSDSTCSLNDLGEAYCKNNKDHLNVPLIVGLSVGLPLAVLCIVTVIGCIWYKKKYTTQRRINVREANYSERPSTPKESLSGSRPSSATTPAWTDKDQLVS